MLGWYDQCKINKCIHVSIINTFNSCFVQIQLFELLKVSNDG